MPDTPFIYCFSGSPYTWRALIALDEKGIAYESKYVPRASGEHKSPEMLAKNPRGKLPVLYWGDLTLYESLAICQFLDLQQPEPPLLPDDAAGRARALVLTHESAYTDAEMGESLLYALGVKQDDGSGARDEAFRRALAEVDRWEAHISDGGDYLVGDALTLADVAVFPQLAFLVRLQLDLSRRHPKLAAWYARMVARPSVQAGWPPHWRESEGKDAGFNDFL